MLVHGEKQVMGLFSKRFENLVGLPCYWPPNGSLLTIDRTHVHLLPELQSRAALPWIEQEDSSKRKGGHR